MKFSTFDTQIHCEDLVGFRLREQADEDSAARRKLPMGFYPSEPVVTLDQEGKERSCSQTQSCLRPARTR